MLSQQELQGNWMEVKGRLLEQWGQLSNQELDEAKGNFNRLVGVIHKRTGEAREKIENFVEKAANGSTVERVTEAVQDYAAQANDTAREYAASAGETASQVYEQAAESLAEGYDQVQDCVRNRPAESVAVTFGAGIIAGALLGIMLKSRS